MPAARALRVSNYARCATFLVSLLLGAAASAEKVTYTTDPATGRLKQAEYRDDNDVVTYTVTYSYDANGNRTGAIVTQAPDTQPPTAPSGLGASVSGTTITLSWTQSTDNRGVAGYKVERCQGPACGSFTQIGTTTSLTYPDSGLTSATAYSYRVRAYDAANFESAYSNIASATTADTVPPGLPGTLGFTSVTQTSATVTWTAATDNVGVASYEYSRNGGSTWTNVGSALTANLTGLTASTSYTVLVRARDAAGNVGASRSGSFSTASPPDTTPPGLPGIPSFTSITTNSATANWTAATDNVGVASYEYSRNGGASWTNVGNVLSASVTGLSPSTSYTVQVRARDAAGNTGNASSGSFTTGSAADTTPPSVPGTPIVSAVTASTASATWSAATDNIGVAGYEYSLNGGVSWTATGSASPGVSLTGLTSTTTYTLRIRARDAAGNTGGFSSSAPFTTLDGAPPTAPGTPTFSAVTGTSATASWTAATDNVAVTAYEYSVNGGSWTPVGSALSANLAGLIQATAYAVQVRARDAANNVGSASSASFTTVDTQAPGAPGTPTFSSITGTGAVASWGAASDNVGVAGYEYSLAGGAWTAASSGVTLGSLTNGTNYSFQVRAFDAAGNRGSASSGSFTTLDTAAPGAPGTPTFSSISGTGAIASWSAATDNVGVSGYEYSLAGGAWTGASSGVTLGGLVNGTTYSFQVRAFDAAGNRGTPSSSSFTTLDTAAPTTPGTPSFSSITGSSAVVSFAGATDNVGVTGYEYLLNGAGWSVASSGMTLSSLANATNYSFQVRAFDAAGNRGGASTNSFTTLDTAGPGAPGTPTFSAITGNSVTANWSAASDNVAVASYEYSINGGGSWTNVGGALSANITGLSGVTTYTVQVRARDTSNNAGSISSASFTTIANITITSVTIVNSTGPFTSEAQYRLTAAGDIMTSASSGFALVDTGDWLVPKSGMSGYQVRAGTLIGTCTIAPPLNTWVPLTSDVMWRTAVSGPGPRSATCSSAIEISAISNPSVILGAAQITVRASH